MKVGIGKIISSGGVLSSAARGWRLAQQTRTGPRDRRLVWRWIGWGAWTAGTVALVVFLPTRLLWIPGLVGRRR